MQGSYILHDITGYVDSDECYNSLKYIDITDDTNRVLKILNIFY